MSDTRELRILFVDDDPFMAQLFERLLADFDLGAISTAADGAEALDLLRGNSIDLLVTDIQMPVMGGLELLKKVRCGESHAARNLRTIVVTSTSPSDTLASAISLDVNGFVTKPFTAESLIQKIVLAMSDDESDISEIDAYVDVVTDLDVLLKGDAPGESTLTGTERSREAVDSTHENQSVPVSLLKAGMELTQDIKTDEGMILLKSGCVLDQRKVERLRDLGLVVKQEEIRVLVNGD